MLDVASMALWYLINPIPIAAIKGLDYLFGSKIQKSLGKYMHSTKDIKVLKVYGQKNKIKKHTAYKPRFEK